MRSLILVITIITTGNTVHAQRANRIFDSKEPITWLGLDFTGAIFIGDREKFGNESDIRYLIGSWNSLMVDEQNKFNINEILWKPKVDYRVDVARAHNETLILKDICSDRTSDHYHLTKSDIELIAESYSFDGLKGVGLMFIVETFNKVNVEASVWVTFIDMETKEILITERMTAPPGGLGLRNYWAGAIYSIMKKIAKNEFEVWRRKYTR